MRLPLSWLHEYVTPDLSDGPLVSAQRDQAGRNIRDIAVGVRQVGIADEIRAPAGHRIAEHPRTQRGFGDAGPEEV